jgi:hypothetical protein
MDMSVSEVKCCKSCGKPLENKEGKKKFRRDKEFCNQKCHDKHKYETASKQFKEFKDEFGLNKYTLLGIQKKLQLIELFGGKCEMCGYNKNISAFDFHHRNPDEKSFEIKVQVLKYLDDSVILEEAMKCMLLCSNCHRELHNPFMDKKHVEMVLELQNKKQF